MVDPQNACFFDGKPLLEYIIIFRMDNFIGVPPWIGNLHI